MNDQQLIKKINKAAVNQRQQRGYIAPLDVLMEIGVLTEQNYEAWRFGKVSYLEKALDIFYHSVLYELMSEGVSDMYCMSDEYLVQKLEEEQKLKYNQ
ncbi:hypothetical protein CIRMBP1197_02399 [Enterococcus cecorum]|nr:hypothetical protein CIRMBP1197_02399 [Enterococcus cecorum]